MEERYRISLDPGTERLFSAGPLIPGSWSHPRNEENGRAIEGHLLVDTGAYGAMIDLDVANALALPSRGVQEIHGIHGYGTLGRYQAKLTLPARDDIEGRERDFMTAMDCVAVPALVEKNREHGIKLIGILGRVFLKFARIEIDFTSGKLNLLIKNAPREHGER